MNVAPIVTTSGDQSATTTLAKSFELGSFSDPDNGPWTITVDWGDGTTSDSSTTMATPGTIPAKTHTYAPSGSYTATVTVTDVENGSASASFQVVASATPPVITTQPSNQAVTAGGTASFSAAATGDPEPAVQWQVSTDNGVTWTAVTGGTSMTYSFTTSTSDNNKRFRAVFTNIASTATSDAALLTVSIPPGTISGFVFNDVNKNQFRDSGEAGLAATITVEQGILVGSAYEWTQVATATSDSVTGAFQFSLDPGLYRVTEFNSAGYLSTGIDRYYAGVSSGGTTGIDFADILNSTPALTAPASQSATTGVAESFDLGSFSDADGVASWRVDVNWGDSTQSDTFFALSTGALSRTHTYSTAGSYTATVTVTDSLNAYDSKSFTVTVAAALQTPSPTPPTGTTSVSVPGPSAWTTTNISLAQGESYLVSASGTIYFTVDTTCYPSGACSYVYSTPRGPEGETSIAAEGATAPGLPVFSLVARIGSTGTPFYVGTGGTFVADGSGNLELGVNDYDLTDNHGEWSATIQTGTLPTPIPTSIP